MKILVTGHTGSLGKTLVPLLLEEGHSVVGVSRCELKQSQMPTHQRFTQYICDVRDRDRLFEASRGVDLVFHLAALKRIESAEEQPEAAIDTNITGTENVLFCQRMNKIPRVVFVSTDKACKPITAYGYTKAISERLVLRNPNNVVARYGNVLASRGSVLQAFKESIEKDGAIRVTNRQCSRFWWTLQEAATYVYLSAMRPAGCGGLCIPNLKSYTVVGLGRALARVMGKEEPHVIEIGFRCIEKIHEDMRTPEEGGEMVSSDQERFFTKSEIDAVLKEVLAIA